MHVFGDDQGVRLLEHKRLIRTTTVWVKYDQKETQKVIYMIVPYRNDTVP